MTGTQETTDLAAVKARLLAEANEANAKYPQYAGYWDTWVVARARNRVSHRHAVMLEAGEFCLLNPDSIATNPESRYPKAVFCTVYFVGKPGAILRHFNASARYRDFEVLG